MVNAVQSKGNDNYQDLEDECVTIPHCGTASRY